MSGDSGAPATDPAALTCGSDPACVRRMAWTGVALVALGVLAAALAVPGFQDGETFMRSAVVCLLFAGPSLLGGATVLFDAERARRETFVFDAGGITVIRSGGGEERVQWSELALSRLPALVHWGSLRDRKGWPRVRLSACLRDLPAALLRVADHVDSGPDGLRPLRFGSVSAWQTLVMFCWAVVIVAIIGAWHHWAVWLLIGAAMLYGDLDSLSVWVDGAGMRTSRWFRVRRLRWDEIHACEVVVHRRLLRREPELLLATAHGPLRLQPSALHLLAALAAVRRRLAERA